MTTGETHKCFAPSCDRDIPLKLLGCRTHWYQLPQHIRDLIWQHYRSGQEHDLQISHEYAEALQLAVEYISGKEGA